MLEVINLLVSTSQILIFKVDFICFASQQIITDFFFIVWEKQFFRCIGGVQTFILVVHTNYFFLIQNFPSNFNSDLELSTHF